MHVEIQVALNFLISFLYNKLPRRRVNQFGEELENALKIKFEGHWYPEKPYKGSAFRCLKTTPPLDPVFDVAARESGMDINDIQENLPQELSIWIDPGEVSYRMSEKGLVKILYSESENIDTEISDREVTRTFNPEAQCFKPIDCMATHFSGLSLVNPTTTAPSPFTATDTSSVPYKTSTSPINAFMPKSTVAPTFTAGSFAQTKFGSTKVKSNSKRNHRMSPTEFSNYIKQRALLQQQTAQQSAVPMSQQMTPNNAALFSANTAANVSPHNSRSLSPNLTKLDSASNFMLLTAAASAANGTNGTISPFGSGTQNPFSAGATSPSGSTGRSTFNGGFENGYIGDLLGSNGFVTGGKGPQQQPLNAPMSRFASFMDKASPYISAPSSAPGSNTPSPPQNAFAGGLSMNFASINGDSGNGTTGATNNSAAKAFDNINFNMNGVSYPNQYQHLLVAN